MSEYLSIDDHFKPPNKDLINFLARFANWYFQPEFLGLDHLDEGQPGLYISNHTLLGLTDGPLYIPKLYNEKNIYLRVLVDNMHKAIPLWRSFLTDFGAVTASKDHAKMLIKQKQHILIFPGGANEVCKTKDNAYQLDWKQRFGFAKMAIKNGYPIIPISSLGGDELYDIIADKKDIKSSKFGHWLKEKGILDKYFKGGETIPPLIKGVGPTLIPKPEKIYYLFGEPIQTNLYDKECTEENLAELRSLTEEAIYNGIEKLKAYRKEHPDENENPIRDFLKKWS